MADLDNMYFVYSEVYVEKILNDRIDHKFNPFLGKKEKCIKGEKSTEDNDQSTKILDENIVKFAEKIENEICNQDAAGFLQTHLNDSGNY